MKEYYFEIHYSFNDDVDDLVDRDEIECESIDYIKSSILNRKDAEFINWFVIYEIYYTNRERRLWRYVPDGEEYDSQDDPNFHK